MLKKGMAWHYVKYSKSQEFARAEATAKKSRIGLWSTQRQIAPWDYRSGERLGSKKNVVNVPPSASTTDRTVYVTRTGEKYHTSSCRYLSKSKRAILLSRAKKDGYEPCKICKP